MFPRALKSWWEMQAGWDYRDNVAFPGIAAQRFVDSGRYVATNEAEKRIDQKDCSGQEATVRGREKSKESKNYSY